MIRDHLPSDDAAVRAVVTAAFGAHRTVADLAEALRRRDSPGASLVAEDDGAVVGHVQLSVSWVDSPERVVAVQVLSPLAVHPDHQRRGIGTALVAAARRRSAELGAPLLFLEGDPAYYSGRGFQPAGPLGFTPPSVRIPGPAFQVCPLPGWAGETGALVYNDTFWSYDAVGLRSAAT